MFTSLRYLILALSFTFTIGCNAKPATDLIYLSEKPPAPSFSLKDMDGKEHKLSDYLGKPVIVSFWATWCPPCRAEIPYFNRAWDKLKKDDIAMLFVNINEGKETIEAYEKNHQAINPTILLDETAGQLHNWNMTGLPTTFIIDPEGRVAYQAMGEREWDNDEILNKVRALKNKDKNKPVKIKLSKTSPEKI